MAEARVPRAAQRLAQRAVDSPRRALGVVLACVLVASVGMAGSAPGAEPDAPLRMISGWVPYWNGDRGPQGIVAMGPYSNTISPFAYEVLGADRVERRGTPDINARMRQASVAAKLPLVTTVYDSTDNGLMASILKDPAQRAIHINALVDMVLEDGFDGVDLDYENFAFEDGYDSWATTEPAWTTFVAELSTALHTYAKLLYVTIPTVTDNNRSRGSGYWVYNPVGIAPFADRIRIMAYAYSWNTPGPNAPLDWTQRIVDYVKENLPASKVELGVPTYGRDWILKVTGTCPAGVRLKGRTALRTDRAVALAAEKGIVPERGPDGEMRFSYSTTYTGPPPGAGSPSEPDPPDGIGPLAIEGPTSPAGRVLVPMDDDVTWPFPVDPDPPSTDPPSTDPPSTNPPSTNPPSTNPPGDGGNDGGSPPTTDPSLPPVTGPGAVTCTLDHTVYYPDAGSTLGKLQQVIAAGLGGIVIFAIGYEEAGHFNGLGEILSQVPHAKGVDPMGEFDIRPADAGRFAVSGWAMDPEASLPIIVRISVDGEVRKQLLANGEVPELATRYPGNGPFHGIETTVRADAGTHRVCVQAIGLGAGTTLRWISCKSVTVEQPA